MLGVLAARLKPVRVHFSWRPQLPDSGDEMLLECAVNGMASAIVTFDRKHIEAGARMFGIPVPGPGSLVRPLGPMREASMTSSYALRLPGDLIRAAKEDARRNGTSLNQCLPAAVAEKVGADRTEALFGSHAGRAGVAAFRGIMARVPDARPVPGDEIEGAPAG